MPLTKEQFASARAAGFDVNQIVAFEKRRASESSENPIMEFGKGAIRGTMGMLPSQESFDVAGNVISPVLGPATAAARKMLTPMAEDVASKIELEKRPVTIGGQVAGGIGEIAPALIPMGESLKAIEGAKALSALRGAGIARAIARPAIGFAGYEAGKAALTTPETGNNRALEVLKAGGEGLKSGAVFGAAGVPFRALGRAGQAISGGLAMSALAPKGEEVSQGILGAGLGAMGEGKPQELNKGQKAILERQATGEYRKLLRPTQGEIKNIEIRKGKNIDDFYTLMAEHQLPMGVDADKKLDTTEARNMIWPIQSELRTKLDAQIESNPEKQFNLDTVATLAKKELKSSFPNAKEYEDAKATVDEYIDAEKRRFDGRSLITGTEANDVKDGMWSVAYNKDKPTAHVTPRKIGFIIKDAIEKAYPDAHIKELNDLSSKYATMQHLLENAQGRVVQGGKLGNYFARTAGAIAGTAAGSMVPVPVIGPAVGALTGQQVGGMISDFVNSPERRARMASVKAIQAGIKGRQYNQVSARELLPKKDIPATQPNIQEEISAPKDYNDIANNVINKYFARGARFLINMLPDDRATLKDAYKNVTGKDLVNDNLTEVMRELKKAKNKE